MEGGLAVRERRRGGGRGEIEEGIREEVLNQQEY